MKLQNIKCLLRNGNFNDLVLENEDNKKPESRDSSPGPKVASLKILEKHRVSNFLEFNAVRSHENLYLLFLFLLYLFLRNIQYQQSIMKTPNHRNPACKLRFPEYYQLPKNGTVRE